jgi:hypothetical protein
MVQPLASSASSMDQLAAEIVLPSHVECDEDRRRSEKEAFDQLLALNMDLHA